MNHRTPPGRPRSSGSRYVFRAMNPHQSPWMHLLICASIGVGVTLLIYKLVPNSTVRRYKESYFGAATTSASAGSMVDPKSQAVQWGTHFTSAPPDAERPPEITAIPIPDFPGAMAIWGASGRDSHGRLYFGVSAVEWKGQQKGQSLREVSARLFEFDPVARTIRDRGGPVEQLKRLGRHRAGEQQQKIHSKIVEGPDGALYFASGDEAGAEFGGQGKNPTWPSHLWRLAPGTDDWEHLMTTPEHLIAVARGGSKVFALGWHGHVVYAYDTKTGEVRRARAGSLLGHISRNLIADARGHVYVPRIKVEGDANAQIISTLVEYDEELDVVQETPLEHYLGESPQKSHGITGVQPLADGSIAFVTHAGCLYQIFPNSDRPADVVKLGWFHPTGPGHYIASLFSYDGATHLLGMTHDESGPEWVVFNIKTQQSRSTKLPNRVPVMRLRSSSGESPLTIHAQAALAGPYGCSTRDEAGNFYFVGRIGYDPVVYQARPWNTPDGPISLASTEPLARPAEPEAPRVEPAGSGPAPALPRGTVVVRAPETPGPPREVVPAGPAVVPVESAPDPKAPAVAADRPLPGADDFPPSSPALEPSPSEAAKLAAVRSLEESWRRRGEFRKELFSILDAEGDAAGPSIKALCDRYGRDVPADAKRAVGILAKTPVTRSDLTRRVTIFRGSGVPEPVLLEDILRLERASVGSRGGPRTVEEARVRAARSLLAIPLPKSR